MSSGSQTTQGQSGKNTFYTLHQNLSGGAVANTPPMATAISHVQDRQPKKGMNKLPVIMKPLLKFGAVRPGLNLEDVSRCKKMYFEQTCVVCLIVRPSMGRGLLNCKAFGGSRVTTRRCIPSQEDVFLSKLVLFT